MSEHDDYEPHHESSPTDQLIQDLALHGYRPSEDELDQRPPPEDRLMEGAVADIFDALVATITDTSLDFDLPDLLWSTVNMFHRAVVRIEQKLDDNEQAQKQLQREQDGSEVESLQLERLIDIGKNLIDRRDGMETFREAAPFKRNDQMLSVVPIGVVIFPGAGIQDNLADKAREMGIQVYRLGSGGAS